MKASNKDRLVGAGFGIGALLAGYEIWKHFFPHDYHHRMHALPEHEHEHENARGEYGHHHKHHHEHGG